MDPNQTFQNMFKAMCVKDHESARELAIALKHWLSTGGFYPNDRMPDATTLYIESVLTRTAGPLYPDFPFSLVCWYCDDGAGIASEEEAMELGWIAIEPAPQLLQANYLGVCPDCRPRYEADSIG